MALFNLRDLRAGMARNQRLIGLDPGSRSIGVALSDVGLSLASPYGVIRRGRLRDNAAEIIAIARKEGAGGLVVGLPLSMDGSVGPAAQSASDWALALSEESAADGIMGRAAIIGGGQPAPGRRGRPQPAQARRGGGPHGSRLDAARRVGRQSMSPPYGLGRNRRFR